MSDSMESYAKKRNKKIASDKKKEAAPAPVASDSFSSRYDLDTLTRAEEIRKDKVRHRAVKAEAKKQSKHLSVIISGGRKKGANRGRFGVKES